VLLAWMMPVADTMTQHIEHSEQWRVKCQSFRSRLLCFADEYEDLSAQHQKLLSLNNALQHYQPGGEPLFTEDVRVDIGLLGPSAPPPPASTRATLLSGRLQNVSWPSSLVQNVRVGSEATMVTSTAQVCGTSCLEPSSDFPATQERQQQIIRVERCADSSSAGPSQSQVSKGAAPQDNNKMQIGSNAKSLSIGRLKRRCVLKRMNLCVDEADTDLGDLNVILVPQEEALLRETLSDLWVKFKLMDNMSDGLVDARELQLFCLGRRHARADHEAFHLELEGLIVALNDKGKFVNEAEQCEERLHQLSFDAFVELMLMEDVTGTLGPKMADDVCSVRRLFLKKTATDFLAHKTRVNRSVFSDNSASLLKSYLVDVITAAVIMANVVFIGFIAENPSSWIGWRVLEMAFVAFFTAELACRMWLVGFVELFCGYSAGWHRFEAFMVAVSIIDTMIFLVGKNIDSGAELQVLRILRLFRLARVAQLLRLKSVKELVLMINGCAASMKTLFWALLLISTMIYFLGITLHQFLGPSRQLTCLSGSATCAESILYLDELRADLFKSVPNSMFTVFRCLLTDCTAPNGTPILTRIFDVYGALVIVPYVLVFFGITVGVYNLIAAILVEHTLETAKRHEQTRYQIKGHEFATAAQRLRDVILSLYSQEDAENSAIMGVTRDVFEEVIKRKEVTDILEDLEINVSNADELFDVLDADRSGTLHVSEMIKGLLKMRGTVSKFDTVAVLLAVQNIQTCIASLEYFLVRYLPSIDITLKQVEEAVQRYSSTHTS